MLEYAITFVLVLIPVVGGVWLWRAIRGRPSGPWNAAGRIALVALVVFPAAAFGVWKASKSRDWQAFGLIVARVQTEERVVALTFDDGPVPEYASAVLGILQQEQVPATFFVCGDGLAHNPELAQQMVAAGHELGNHTYTHRVMMGLSLADARSEVERTDDLIRAAGQTGSILFRPPFSKKWLALPYYMATHGRTSITWDVEPDSYPQVARSAEAMTEHVLANTKPGSIILLHPWYTNHQVTAEALPGIIQGLKAQGYRFVTVSQLLAVGR